MTILTLTNRGIQPVGGPPRRRCSVWTWIEAGLFLAIWIVWFL